MSAGEMKFSKKLPPGGVFYCPAMNRTAQLFRRQLMTRGFSSRLFSPGGAGAGSSSPRAVTRRHTLSKLSNSIVFTAALYSLS